MCRRMVMTKCLGATGASSVPAALSARVCQRWDDGSYFYSCKYLYTDEINLSSRVMGEGPELRIAGSVPTGRLRAGVIEGETSTAVAARSSNSRRRRAGGAAEGAGACPARRWRVPPRAHSREKAAEREGGDGYRRRRGRRSEMPVTPGEARSSTGLEEGRTSGTGYRATAARLRVV